MATPTSPYTTLGNIRSAIVNDAKEASSTTLTSQLNRWINEGYEEVAFRKKRDWLDSQIAYQVNSAVNAVCTVTKNSSTVTFTAGTTFPSGVELQFWQPGFQEVYNVASVSNNVLTLSNPYLGSTNTAANGYVAQSSVILDPTVRYIYQVYHQYQTSPVQIIDPQQMRQLQAADWGDLDYATWASVFGENNSTSQSRRLVLWPYPYYAYTFYVDVNTWPTLLVNDSDTPQIPIQHRRILYWYGLAKLYDFHRNTERASEAWNQFNRILAQMDAEMRAEVEMPQITVAYPKGRSLKIFAEPFNPMFRDTP